MTLTLNDSSLIKSQSFIDGHWVHADSGETLAVTNPATNETLIEVAKCGTAETTRQGLPGPHGAPPAGARVP